jgi:sporulation protein YlmC with PRC-barrel domain
LIKKIGQGVYPLSEMHFEHIKKLNKYRKLFRVYHDMVHAHKVVSAKTDFFVPYVKVKKIKNKILIHAN